MGRSRITIVMMEDTQKRNTMMMKGTMSTRAPVRERVLVPRAGQPSHPVQDQATHTRDQEYPGLISRVTNEKWSDGISLEGLISQWGGKEGGEHELQLPCG